MQPTSRIRVYKGVEVEVITYGQPDHQTALKTVLPLVLEIWDKSNKKVLKNNFEQVKKN